MIIHQIEQTHFSDSEAVIIQYILNKGLDIKNMTTKEIAEATYTSPSLLIRIAKKMGYDGWNNFKKAFLEELDYMYSSQDIDASIPFLISDDISIISNNIFKLHEETIEDTKRLMKHDDLMHAVRLLRDAKYIDIYTRPNKFYLAQSFTQKMYSIKRRVDTVLLSGNDYVQASMSDYEHCAIIISYSGETNHIIQLAKKLKENHTPIIAITSISKSSLVKLADVSLRMSSREMLNTKIGDFASSETITCILDILYSCFFALDYTENLNYKLSIAGEIDDRYSEYEYIDETKRK